MNEVKRQSRYEFLSSSFDSPHERAALQKELERFMAGPAGIVVKGLEPDQLVNHFKYSVAGLNAEGNYKSVTHELAYAFSWIASKAGDDYWTQVHARYETKRRNAATKAIADVKARTPKDTDSGDKLAVEAMMLVESVERHQKEVDEDDAARALREAHHTESKIQLLRDREAANQLEFEPEQPLESQVQE